MFIYSLRAGTVKFFGIIIAGVAALAVLLAVFPLESDTDVASSGIESVSYENIKDDASRINFLMSLGYSVEPTVLETKTVRIPNDFDKTMTAYNELQKQAGLDLSKYKGKEAELYSYSVTNYPGYEGRVIANILVWRGRVIGGDITSADIGGFMHGLTQNKSEGKDIG